MRISLWPISTAMFSSAPWITAAVIGSMRSGLAGWRRGAVLIVRSLHAVIRIVSA